MSPSLTSDNLRNVILSYWVSLGNVIGCPSLFGQVAYVLNIVCSQLGSSMRFALNKAMLIHGIMYVIFWGSKKKMFGVYAWRVIATMKNLLSRWDCSIVKFPRKAMSKQHDSFTVLIWHPYHAILRFSRDLASCPNPTRFIFLNVLPKSLFDWFGFRSSFVHGLKLYDFVGVEA